MPSNTRRGFLGGSALTLTALAGLLEPHRTVPFDVDESSPESDPTDLLEPLPSADVVDAEYRTVVVQTVDVDADDAADVDASDLPHETRVAIDALDVSPGKLTHLVSVFPGSYRRRLGVAAGEFDTLVDDPDEEVNDWAVADADDVAIAAVEGHAAFAGGETTDDRLEAAVAMARAATGEADRFLEDNDEAETTIDAFGDYGTILFVPDPGGTGYPLTASGRLRALGGGFEAHPFDLEGTAEHEYLLFPVDGVDLEEEAIRRIIGDVDPGHVVESDITRPGGAVRVNAVVEAPPERDRDAAPDARVRTSFDRESTTLTFEHADGDAVPATELELWVDGERVDEQPEDELDAFEAGDTLSVTTGPVGTAVLRWFDEERNVQYVYASETVDREAFELEHDFEDRLVEISYVGVQDADPAKLAVTHRSDDGIRRIDEPFADAGEQIAAGDTFAVEDVGVEERVTLEVDVPSVPGVHRRPLGRLRVSPPRIHLHNHPEEGMIARYRDELERDAEEFRLLVDGEPADVQFADEVDTLARGEMVPLGEFPVGSHLTVEWHEPDDTVVVADTVVTPRVRASMEYDENEGTVRIEHSDGEAIPADDLELRIDMEPADIQPADEFEEFSSGDAFTVEVPAMARVELVWIHPEREHRLGGTTTARDAIEATYDPESERMTLTYRGAQPVDPERIHVRHRGPSARGTDSETVFAEEYEELTSDDAVDIDAEIGDRITVSVRVESEKATTMRTVAHFATEPRRGFTFREADGEVTAVYTDRVVRDADEFRLLVDGNPADVQPDDVHDELEREATIELGTFPGGTTLSAEWTAPDKSREVGEHVIAPEVSFEAEYDSESEEITVIHTGGDPIDAGYLSVVAPPGIPQPIPWDRASDADQVAEGDEATFEVEASEEDPRSDSSPAPDSDSTSDAEPLREIIVLFRNSRVLYREELASNG
ncbi:hypothetical protein AArcSl_3219 [Halalkaliarchaeum desulfuricum]|uniref:Uncharacterized protein n=1 Tax=Halalkaliarchaeum desulfuricum TaxID=2055893 RepID=A0A343TP03_9EURY|nr:hypothetical protein [Halalkaliarchaeum desulfuricum]AUX10825.1 hypothetical protein AArcSl_3219 [Halalkaliarchaeum desulfuricum]